MDSGNPIAPFLLLLFAFVIYFLPTFVASSRKHVNGTSIFLMNLLLGWTFLGWVGALVWASSANTERPAEKAAPTNTGDRLCPYCAETIKNAAIKCKHCGADVMPQNPPRLKAGWVASTACRDEEEQKQTIEAIESTGLPVVSMMGLAVGAGPFETKEEAKQALIVMRDGPRLFSEIVYRDSVSGKYPPIPD
ncbi:Superinfection immunity protein [Pseudomonas sp. NFACC49-2]|uniref:superinfection immunity protein n=1 Tax=Pseudomonas sp. NFACC49-2 TaxID=1566222 RepID=UPI0009211F0A|nr:superinfection immunity protein [Pseudomonas sp. NFACC49-2]SFX16900.1 Superinfection immunity protein [Pseudomonas sp. NFACC49-2]